VEKASKEEGCSMSSQLYPLSSLYPNRLFRVPDYQRGYAWKKEQLEDFWEDLLNLHDERYHYTGLLSLKKIGKEALLTSKDDSWLLESGYNAYHIVDGQQRLTTFSILIYEIIRLVENLDENQDRLEDEMFIGFESVRSIKEKYIVKERPPENLIKTYKFGYERDNPSYNYLKHRIFEEPYGGKIDETYYTQNLMFAKRFFSSNLKALYQEEGLTAIESLYKKLTLNLTFNLHEIEDDYDVFVAFETMNNRGKKLSNLELLKNRLIYLTTLYDSGQLDRQDGSKLRDNINNAWKEIYYQLGRNRDHPLHDDELLRNHWTSYFKYTRRKGDDYIRFLLEKFSTKNVFEKHPVLVENEILEPELSDEDYSDDELYDHDEVDVNLVSDLAPQEIKDYVNSLKEFSEYWYYTFFPGDSKELSENEKEWINKLDRLGMGYFRPLVAVALSLGNQVTQEERIYLLKEIERFIFLNFRMARFNPSYQSAFYYNKARELAQDNSNLTALADDLRQKTDDVLHPIISNFMARTDKRFENDAGFYAWRDLRYFLFEYESHLSVKNNLPKVFWQQFSKSEKDKVTIEHILPQTPNKWYWRNQFRHFSDDEIKFLSGSLGNLLPLAQSINSSLQNDSFPEKKHSSSKRRGYMNGSHSEIEVAQEEDWTASSIMDRGLRLLSFMEIRWRLRFTDEQKQALLHISFVNEYRDEKPELPKPSYEFDLERDYEYLAETEDLNDLQMERLKFWTHFVEYCQSTGRSNDIGSRQASQSRTYDVSIGSSEYIAFFQVMKTGNLRIGLHIYQTERFEKLKSMKAEMEVIYGSTLEWDVSRKNSKSKRIIHEIKADAFNPERYRKNFDWLVNQFDKLMSALAEVDDDF